MQQNDSALFFIDITTSSFATLSFVNSVAFYVVNWVGLFILCVLVYRIRHTGDDTFLKAECVWIVSLFTVFSIL